MLLLSIGILPFSVTFNAISSFNNSGEHRKIIVIGSIEFLTFLAAFFFLVPTHRIADAAVSVLLAFIAASIPSMIWLGRTFTRYVAISSAAVIIGVIVSYIFSLITGMQPIIQIIASFIATTIMMIALKNIRLLELEQIIRTVARKK